MWTSRPRGPWDNSEATCRPEPQGLADEFVSWSRRVPFPGNMGLSVGDLWGVRWGSWVELRVPGTLPIAAMCISPQAPGPTGQMMTVPVLALGILVSFRHIQGPSCLHPRRCPSLYPQLLAPQVLVAWPHCVPPALGPGGALSCPSFPANHCRPGGGGGSSYPSVSWGPWLQRRQRVLIDSFISSSPTHVIHAKTSLGQMLYALRTKSNKGTQLAVLWHGPTRVPRQRVLCKTQTTQRVVLSIQQAGGGRGTGKSSSWHGELQ